MYILLRNCSAYTEPDILLGVYTTREQAEKDRLEYIETLKHRGDQHQRQGYMQVDLEVDVVIQEAHTGRKCDDGVETQCYCVFSYSEIMGQVARMLEYIAKSEESAIQNAIRLHKAELDDELGMECEWLYEIIEVNKLRYENSKETYIEQVPYTWNVPK